MKYKITWKTHIDHWGNLHCVYVGTLEFGVDDKDEEYDMNDQSNNEHKYNSDDDESTSSSQASYSFTD